MSQDMETEAKPTAPRRSPPRPCSARGQAGRRLSWRRFTCWARKLSTDLATAAQRSVTSSRRMAAILPRVVNTSVEGGASVHVITQRL